MKKAFQYSLTALGILLSVPLIALLVLLPSTPVTWIGSLYLFSYALIVIGLVCASWIWNRSLVFVLAGGILALVIVSIRMAFPPSGSQVNIITLPSENGTQPLNRILNEQDAVLFGAQLGPYVGQITDTEKESLVRAFSQTYKDMHAYGATPLSPFLATYLNQQQTLAFDAVIAEPKSASSPDVGIIFLHGFGGNFTVQCWLVAKAGFSIHALTVCPSTSPLGTWWTSQSKSILHETVNYLHRRGVERIYLAGLSNGAIGASHLAEEYHKDLAGLILISGADPGAAITGLPVLVIHGNEDERIPVSLMEEYTSVAGNKATYHLFDGDHFLLLKQAARVQEVVTNWLIEQEP